MSIQDIVQAIADNAKSGKWLNCTFQVQHTGQTFAIGVKAFGKWVQHIECCGFCDGVPEQKTVKALRAESEKTILAILRTLGA